MMDDPQAAFAHPGRVKGRRWIAWYLGVPLARVPLELVQPGDWADVADLEEARRELGHGRRLAPTPKRVARLAGELASMLEALGRADAAAEVRRLAAPGARAAPRDATPLEAAALAFVESARAAGFTCGRVTFGRGAAPLVGTARAVRGVRLARGEAPGVAFLPD